MKWLLLLLFTIFSEATRDHRGRSVNTNATAIFDSFAREPYFFSPMNRKGLSRRLFSTWSRWSECHDGHRTRWKHCLRAEVCGDGMRLEVSSCEEHEDLRRQLHKQKRKENIHRKSGYKQRMQVRQLNPPEPSQRRLRGFSPWSPWSSCSRTCTTVRRRYCRRASTCGRKVIRQSAYCYVEGGYCHRWIRGKMHRRKNPAYTVVDSESMPSPQHAIHSEDARPSPKEPECGRIGRVIGSAARRRIRMHDMMRIIGGRPAPPGKWPWQVAVLNRYKEAFCGGTLISLRWAATAAHCVRARLFVRLGEHDLRRADRGELELRVSEAVLHPHYDPDTVVNDVALLRLPAPARPDLGHGVACLPQGQPLRPRAPCTILGWGKRRATDDHGTRLLYEAQVSTIPQGVCRRSYWQYAITSDMVCAGRGRRDSCAGDSGGPLLCREGDKYYLQGITSFGDGCGKRGKFGIYTRTAGYVTWMKQVMAHKYFDD